MNINYKQPQFELFPANSATLEDVNKPRFLLANLTLSIESLVILTILGIMVALFAFSLGVERGKHLAAQALDERVAAAWNLAPKKPAMPVVAKTVAAKPVLGKSGLVKQAAVVAVAAKTQVVQKPTMQKPVTVALPVAAERYTLQAASYKNEAYAKQEALALKAKGFKTFLIKKGDFWLVCLGQFTNAETAKAALAKVPQKYRDSSVRRF
jgi:cell division septation protein DedD